MSYTNRIVAISIDEGNRQYSVKTESGLTYDGYKGLNLIRFEKVKNAEGKEYLEAYITEPYEKRN